MLDRLFNWLAEHHVAAFWFCALLAIAAGQFDVRMQ